MTADISIDGVLLNQAAEWNGVWSMADPEHRERFVDWIKDSPEQLKAYLLNMALDTELSGEPPEDQRCGPLRTDASDNVIQFPTRSLHTVNRALELNPGTPSSPSPLSWIGVAIAVLVALFVAGLLPYYFARSIDTQFYTNVGQTRAVTLPDGTVVRLDTRSRIAARYTPWRRDIVLEAGRILVIVAQDRGRPFRVFVGGLTIRDVGTAFGVTRSSNETTVYVQTGRVRLSAVSPGTPTTDESDLAQSHSPSLEIGSGDEAVVKTNEDGTLSSFTARHLPSWEAQQRTAWTRGVLMFMGESLADVVREVNRYQERPIVIVDSRLQALKIGGTLDPTHGAYQAIKKFACVVAPDCSITVDTSDPSVIQLR